MLHNCLPLCEYNSSIWVGRVIAVELQRSDGIIQWCVIPDDGPKLTKQMILKQVKKYEVPLAVKVLQTIYCPAYQSIIESIKRDKKLSRAKQKKAG